MTTAAIIDTQEASAYIRKLCRHFSVKVAATYTESEGNVDFPFGKCVMQASPGQLIITIQVEDDTAADKAEHVIVSHLSKFAWREQLNIQWNRQSAQLV